MAHAELKFICSYGNVKISNWIYRHRDIISRIKNVIEITTNNQIRNLLNGHNNITFED